MKKRNFIRILLLILVSSVLGAIQYIHVDAQYGTGNSGEGTGWADAVNLDTLAVMTITAPAVVYIRGDGSPSGNVNLSTQDGTDLDPILITGVLSGTTDEGSAVTYSSFSKITDTAAMPLLDFDVYNFTAGDYTITRGIAISSAITGVVTVGNYAEISECWIRNDYSGTAGRNCVACGTYLYIHNCILSASAAHGIYTSTATVIENNTFVDFTDDLSQGRYAIWLGTGLCVIVGNKFKNCSVGIELGTQDYNRVLSNTFYSGGTFLDATDAHHCVITNNVVYNQSGKFGVWTTQTDGTCFYNNHTTSIDDFTLVDTNSYFRDFELTVGDPLIDTITLAVEDTASAIYRDPESSAP